MDVFLNFGVGEVVRICDILGNVRDIAITLNFVADIIIFF
jgi:hypothetical protein